VFLGSDIWLSPENSLLPSRDNSLSGTMKQKKGQNPGTEKDVNWPASRRCLNLQLTACQSYSERTQGGG
jgi:hypothetical protein